MTTDQKDGFEYQGRFYPWTITDGAKDLMLIDRFTGMSVIDFFETIEDEVERGRGPILLALIATSMRAAFPDRSVERIARTVESLNLSEVTFFGGDEVDPPAETPERATSDSSGESVDASKSSATPAAS